MAGDLKLKENTNKEPWTAKRIATTVIIVVLALLMIGGLSYILIMYQQEHDDSAVFGYYDGQPIKYEANSVFYNSVNGNSSYMDAMLSGDQESIGGRVLGALDQSVDNLVTRIAELGSEHERATLNIARNSQTSLNVTQMISTEGDLDFTKAITDMKMLDYVHQATLSVAGKLYSSSLLNYMR